MAERVGREAFVTCPPRYAFRSEKPDPKDLCNELGRDIQRLRRTNDDFEIRDTIERFSARWVTLFKAAERFAPRTVEATRQALRGSRQ